MRLVVSGQFFLLCGNRMCFFWMFLVDLLVSWCLDAFSVFDLF